MQDYTDFAEKNGVILKDTGPCQFCGAQVKRGVHECLEIFNFGFSGVDYNSLENLQYKFFVVDAHTLQHPEIHGRWNNHFHLTRLTLTLRKNVQWRYQDSPRLSDILKAYKQSHPHEVLSPPTIGARGGVTTSDVLAVQDDSEACKKKIIKWAETVYESWQAYHQTVDVIAELFLKGVGK